MATVHAQTTYDTSASSPSAANLARWPVYTNKEDALIDLLGAIGGGAVTVSDVLQRLSNTDTSTWTDKGSRVN